MPGKPREGSAGLQTTQAVQGTGTVKNNTLCSLHMDVKKSAAAAAAATTTTVNVVHY